MADRLASHGVNDKQLFASTVINLGQFIGINKHPETMFEANVDLHVDGKFVGNLLLEFEFERRALTEQELGYKDMENLSHEYDWL